MTFLSRRVLLGLAAGALGLGAGCGGPGAFMYFLMPEQRFDARMKHLPREDDKENKEPRVAILTWMGTEMRSEFIHADRQLSELVAQQIKGFAEASKEKIAFVPVRKVEQFKSDHPSWRSMGLEEVGRKLDVDYVIFLEIESLSLYEPGNANTLMRGRANIAVSLIDVHDPDDAPVSQQFTSIFPSDAQGPVHVGIDTQPMHFRQAFFVHLARELAQYFSKHPRSERQRMERPI